MSTEPTAITVRKPPAEAIKSLERVVLMGDLGGLSEEERVGYYARVCESLGLNPLTRPFEYITLNGKLTLYARKDATDQLRDMHGVSIVGVDRDRDEALSTYVVTAHARDRYGRVDSAIGVVSIAGLKGEALSNAMMKAETKAKRRVTLSIVGLGWMDEVEARDARAVEVAPRTELASGIRARTRALESASSEAPSEAVSMPSAEVPPAAAEGASSGNDEAAACTHSELKSTDNALVCASCGEVIAEREPKPKARKARDKKPGDEGYGTARAHAVAAERGLDHDAVRRIAFDLPQDPHAGATDFSKFSVSTLDEDQWAEVIAAISEAPKTEDVNEAANFAGRMALQAGMGEGNDPWPEADPALVEMFGHDDPFSAAELIEFGIRVYARNPLP